MLRSLKLLILAALAAPLYAQAPASQTSAPAPAASGVTLHANPQLVVVDVVVTDKNQQSVHNLKQSDFNVLEGGKPQSVQSFEEHTALPPAEAAKLPSMPRMPPGVFTNFTPAPEGGTVNVLLLDALNTPMNDQSFVRDQLLKYVKNAPPGARVAIFGLTSRLIMLQGFTSDPELLKTVVEKKAGPKGSILLDDSVGGLNLESTADQLTDIADGNPDMDEVIGNVQQLEAVTQSFQTMLRVRYTLDAMNLLARYLGGIPGRKNLIWFSGSFPLTILPDSDLKDPFAVVADSEDEFRETIGLLARSQVAVYPIDARGLMTDPSMNATASGIPSAHSSPRGLSASQKFFLQTSAEHGTMQDMAEATGGRAFVNTNALAASVGKAIDAGSNYYTLNYSPSDPKHDGSFRKIQVKLEQQGLTLAYRRGYYADSAKLDSSSPSASAANSSNAVKLVGAAMLRGGPAPTQILMKARVLPSTLTPEDNPARGNSVNPQSKAAKGPYRRYRIDVLADPRTMAFVHTPDGKYASSLEFLAFLYDQDGTLINHLGNAIHPNVPIETYKQMLQSGIQFHAEISVPLKGDYYLRIGLHDIGSDRIGAIEVPLAVVKNLPPPPEATAPAVAPK